MGFLLFWLVSFVVTFFVNRALVKIYCNDIELDKDDLGFLAFMWITPVIPVVNIIILIIVLVIIAVEYVKETDVELLAKKLFLIRGKKNEEN